MISFKCDNCQTPLRVDVKHAGKRVRCSKCSGITNIPHKTSAPPVFCICAGCKANFNASDSLTAKTVQCPKCQAQVTLPAKDQITSDDTTVRFTCKQCNMAYCVPAKYAGKKFPCVSCKTACSIPKLPEPEPEEELALMDADSFDWDSVDDFATGTDNQTLDKNDQSQEDSDSTDETFHDPFAFNASAHAKKKQGIPKMASTKKMLIIGGCVVGFYIVLLSGFIFFIGQTPPDKSTEAMQFSRNLIREINRGVLGMPTDIVKVMNMDTNFAKVAEFIDKGMPEEDLQVIAALDIGRITNIEPTIEHAAPAFGTSGFIIKSKVESEEGIERQVIVTAVEYANNFNHLQISVNDSSGYQLASTGEQTIEQLKVELDLTAATYSWLSPGLLKYGVLVIVIVLLLNVISWWRVLDMAGQPGWAALIPIYQSVALARAGDRSTMIGVGCALAGGIPLVGGLVSAALFIYITLGVAKTYNRSIPFGVGLGFLPLVFFPVLAFSENTFN